MLFSSISEGILVVEWDACSRNTYRFGPIDSGIEVFEVQVCNVPRILENELIATGCIVKRGVCIYIYIYIFFQFFTDRL